MGNMMDDFFNAPLDDFDPNAGNNPKPHEGKQICMVKLYGPKDTQKKGTIMRVDLMVVQPAPGSTYVQGSHCGIAWYVNESDTTKRRYERARAGEFVLALLGLAPKTVYGPHSQRLSQTDQPGQGIMIAIYGERNGQYLNYRYEHIPQTGEQIAANRAVVDRVKASEAANGLPGGQQPQPQTQPQHMQQAPHPSQMQQQYPAQTGYPQQPQPQQPMQPYPVAPQQQYPQAPVQPQPQGLVSGIPGLKF